MSKRSDRLVSWVSKFKTRAINTSTTSLRITLMSLTTCYESATLIIQSNRERHHCQKCHLIYIVKNLRDSSGECATVTYSMISALTTNPILLYAISLKRSKERHITVNYNDLLPAVWMQLSSALGVSDRMCSILSCSILRVRWHTAGKRRCSYHENGWLYLGSMTAITAFLRLSDIGIDESSDIALDYIS